MVLSYKIANLATASPEEYLTQIKLNEHPMGIWAFRGINADFEFWIDNICVLKEPGWNVGELAMQLNRWSETGLKGNFYYDCMDAEETGLFTFVNHDTHFYFSSEWQKVSVTKTIDKIALEQFITELAESVKENIKRQLGYDVGFYLK